MKIPAKSTFKRQTILWAQYSPIAFFGIISVSGSSPDNSVNIFFKFSGLILLTLSIIFLGRLIFEIYSPKKISLEGKLVKLKYLDYKYKYGKVYDDYGYKIIIEANGQKKRLLLLHKERWEDFGRGLDVLLKKDEFYSITYLSKSKLIVEIESITHPELNEVIDKCFINIRGSKKDRKKAFQLLEKYHYR
ncbi:MAG: hypothetical protein ABRQ27_05365 [Clostridiaceae bacterium]